MATPSPASAPASPSRAWLPPALAGLLAMLALIGVQEAINGFNQAIPSAPRAAAQTIVRLTPGAITNAMIETLGKLAIQLLTASAYAGTALIGLLLGLVAGRLAAAGRLRPAAVMLVAVPFAVYLIVAQSQLRRLDDLPLVVVIGLVMSTFYAGLTLVLWHGLSPQTLGRPLTPVATANPQRRALLGGGLAAVALLAGGGTLLSQTLRARSTVPQALAPLEPLATPTAGTTRSTVTPAASPTAAATTAPPAITGPATTGAAAATRSPSAPASPTAAATAAPAPPPAATTPGPSPEDERFFTSVRGLGPEVTPNDKFYVVDEAIDDPRIDIRQWRLTVRGLVEKPFTLTYNEVRARPAVDQYATLMCISYEVGQDLISTAKWRGVRLADLLTEAGVKPGATHVLLRSVDNYDEAFPLAKAMEPTTLLAYGMNDVVLPVNHGAPLRALVPGHYGYKNVKWLTDIEVISGLHKGYWQRAAGWNQEGRLASAMSRIDTVDGPPVTVGGRAFVGGIAFAGPRGISKVEVSTTGGQTWEPARLKRALSPLSWQLWVYEWQPTTAGKAKLLVRTAEGDGTPQIAEPRAAHPDGATGLHGFDYDVVL